MPDLKQHTLDYHGSDIFYWTHVNRNAPTLLIIPGLSGDHTDLSTLVEYLSRDFTVIIPDLPGWGKSEVLRGRNTLEKYTDVLSTLIKKGGYRDLTIIGHCMGAVLAIQLAHIHPTYVRQLFLLNPPYEDGTLIYCALKKAGEIGKKAPEQIRPLFFFWQYRKLFFIFSLLTSRYRTLRKRLLYAEEKYKKDAPLELLEENTLGIYEFDWGTLSKIKTPTRILHGERDIIVPPKQIAILLKETGRRIPITIVPDAGHLLPMERPGEVARIIRADINV